MTSSLQPLWTELDQAGLQEKFSAWIEMIADMHDGANSRVNETPAFTALGKPLNQANVALLSTAGVHLSDQEPFNVATTKGDASFRLIPDDIEFNQLRFTHTHYDTSSAQADPNVVFPLQRLHEMVGRGRLGATSNVHVGLMGFNPDPTAVADVTAPQIAELFSEAGVDVVVLVPG